jgi:hypothetical protein
MNTLLTEATLGLFEEFLKGHPKYAFVRVQWLDISAGLRMKVITRKFCRPPRR